MTARCYVAGHIAPRSQPAAMRVRGTVVEPTRTPIVARLDVCEVCGGTGCDCITPTAQAAMLERISADPHSYNDLTGLDIPL